MEGLMAPRPIKPGDKPVQNPKPQPGDEEAAS